MVAARILCTKVTDSTKVKAALVVYNLQVIILFECFFVILKCGLFCGVVFHHDNLHIVPAALFLYGCKTAGKVFDIVFVWYDNADFRVTINFVFHAVAARPFLDGNLTF